MTALSRSSFLRGAGAASLALTAPEIFARPMTGRHLQRPVPRLGISIPALGMGTYQTFDTTSQADQTRLMEVLDIFYEAGGRVLDSSPMYGRAEAVVGELTARTPRRAYYLATKVWTRGRQAGIEQMRDSLRLMRTPAMDVMQIHNLVDWRTHIKTLRAWKDSGRIKAIGITHYVPSAFDELIKIIRQEEIDFVQLPYSIARRDAERRLLPVARERRTATIINRPFEGGSLFRQTRDRPLPAFARDLGCESWSNVFLKFILSHPDVTCAIPATSKPRHARDNMRAAFGPLPTTRDRERLARLVR